MFFIFASLYIMIPMFDVLRQMLQNTRKATSRRTTIHSGVSTLSRIAAAGFFVGGLSSVFFLFPGFAPAVHGTRVVVGHFHGFFVIFLCSLFLVLFWLVSANAQSPAAATQTCGLFILLVACAVFFLTSVSAGFLGSLRRVAGVAGKLAVYSVVTNSALAVGSLIILMFGLYLVVGRRVSSFACAYCR